MAQFSSLKQVIFMFICQLISLKLTNQQNIDTSYPIIIDNPSTSPSTLSMFGHSILVHTNNNNRSAEPIIIIGAPNATNDQGRTTGGLYECRLNLSQGPRRAQCKSIRLWNRMNFYERNLFVNHMHLGWNLEHLPESNDRYMSCVYSWTRETIALNVANEPELWLSPNGACFLLPFDYGSKDFQSQSTLILPMSEALPFKGNGDYYHAYGMAGFSADTGQYIYLGAPGFNNWRGAYITIAKTKWSRSKIEFNDVQLQSLSDIDKYSYLGYSISSGRYFRSNQQLLAISMPRANFIGSVAVIDAENNRIISKSNGEQLGEYYGYQLLSADINGDNFDDLFVTAPMYSSFTANLYDEGCVYVYISTGDGFKQPIQLKGDQLPHSRFGTAISAIGDVNKDGYVDVAIGAPYESEFKGSVYIYQGRSYGIDERYSQKISALELNDGLKGFGYSFPTRNLDIDHNDYPDLLVGSLLSENVVILRTRPLINIQASIQISDDHVDLNQKCPFNNSQRSIESAVLHGNNSCIRLRYCFDITTSSFTADSMKSMLKAKLELDEYFKRAFIIREVATFDNFNENNSPDDPEDLRYSITTSEIEQNFLLIPPQRHYCSDYYIVYFKQFEKLKNFYDPIRLQLSYSLGDTIDDDVNIDQEHQVFRLPILNNDNNITTELYIKLCNHTAMDCVARFTIEPMFTFISNRFPIDGKSNVFPNRSIVKVYEGQYDQIVLLVNLQNQGQYAFNTELLIETNYHRLKLIKIDEKCSEIHSEKLIHKRIACKLTNPLETADSIRLKFESFELNKVTSNDNGQIWFNFHLNISNKFDSNSHNDYNVTFGVIRRADFSVQILNPKPQGLYRKFSNIDHKPMLLQSMIAMEREGYSNLEGITLEIVYPSQFNDEQYISDVDLKSAAPIEFECQKPEDISLADAQNRLVYNQSTIHMNCLNRRIICRKIQCTLRSWPKSLPMLHLTIDSYLNLSNLNRKYSNEQLSSIIVDYDIAFSSMDRYLENFQEINGDSNKSKQIRFILKRIEPDQMNRLIIFLWIAIAVIIGLLLLTLIGFIIYKLGFFKRKHADNDSDSSQ